MSMKIPHHNTVRAFWRRILSWYERHGRDLPWRPPALPVRGGKAVDPYAVLVSEIMLQQTQVGRVQEKWPQFLEQFPAVEVLATASRGDVLRAWQGMGYNRRALNLQKAAVMIVERHDGVVPQEWESLRALPGIGDYTASAVRVFAFNLPDVAVDVNVQRVLGRHLFDGNRPDGAVLRANAERLIPDGRARDAHNALMDFGSLVCTADINTCDGWRCTALQKRRTRTRSEPSHRGTPRRIWRGRVVELLREENDLTKKALAELLFDGADKSDDTFVDRILNDLISEGMVARRDGHFMLPS